MFGALLCVDERMPVGLGVARGFREGAADAVVQAGGRRPRAFSLDAGPRVLAFA